MLQPISLGVSNLIHLHIVLQYPKDSSCGGCFVFASILGKATSKKKKMRLYIWHQRSSCNYIMKSAVNHACLRMQIHFGGINVSLNDFYKKRERKKPPLPNKDHTAADWKFSHSARGPQKNYSSQTCCLKCLFEFFQKGNWSPREKFCWATQNPQRTWKPSVLQLPVPVVVELLRNN